MARIYCLGETVAVPLFAHLRHGAAVQPARRALDRVLRDEVRHRDFGWTCLAYLLDLPAAAPARSLIQRSLPAWLADLESSYGDTLEGGLTEVTAAERAWGLAPATDYAAILHRTIDRDYRPRFTRLSIAL